MSRTAKTPSLGSQGGVLGRPVLKPPVDAADRIREAAAKGASMVGVGNALGVCHLTVKKWFDEYPELKEAMAAGREAERHVLHNRLYSIATESKHEAVASTAAMFLLKSRHGYVEGDQGEQGNRVSVTFNLPGALSREEFMKTVVNNDK